MGRGTVGTGNSGFIIALPDVYHTYTRHWIYKHECSSETGNLLNIRLPLFLPSLWNHLICTTAYIKSTIASI